MPVSRLTNQQYPVVTKHRSSAYATIRSPTSLKDRRSTDAKARAWAATFLAATSARRGVSDWMPEPPMIFTCVGLAGVAMVTGNEAAQRFGRNRFVLGAVTAVAILSLGIGWTTGISAVLAAACVVVCSIAIYFDNSALTSGTVQAADQHLAAPQWGSIQWPVIRWRLSRTARS